MPFTHALGALTLVFGTLLFLVGAWFAVRWASHRWPDGSVEVDAGPFESLRALVGQLADRLEKIERENTVLRTEMQLIRQEWDDAYSKMRRLEERVRKRAQRAQDEDYDDEQVPLIIREPPNGMAQGQLEVPAPPPETEAMRRFRLKYGEQV